ncbi:VOC family protein [Cryobacterium melibiosiphilum]|uniref:VOC family protein n=1 Tax=Cryobacterium melibiosiphilum TaxID=995039 RepID=A0A3A5MN62_9MICO|nr:VOC family protein [Cryobacterium melibiosiphilum]RJT87466.1 VOC family protein [Cryobacterium melibiosiphilum]
MPTPDAFTPGEPCWVDLMSSDVDRSKAFYSALFGWTATESGEEYGNYITFWKGDAQVAGLARQLPDSTFPDVWTTYLAVDDVDGAAASARAAGAQILMEPMTVGDQGRMAMILDPTGAAIGLWESAEHAGFEVNNEHGSPVWHELNTRDYDAALAFYRTVFGWNLTPLSDTMEFRYSTFGEEGTMVGGVYDAHATLPEGVPSHWQLYLGVADVPAAAARVVELGGRILREPWDSEFGVFAQVADPTGAMFQLGGVATETASDPTAAGSASSDTE